MPEPLRILLVEDDRFSYAVTRHLLSQVEEWDISLDWCETYEEARECIKQQSHDIYIIDYALDGHTGLDLLALAMELGCCDPIIMLTGLGDREVDMQAMRSGAADYLVKDGLDAATLERSIRYALERKRLNDALTQRAHDMQMLASQLSHAEQRERSRVARLLHDHVQQLLVSVKMRVEHLSPENLAEKKAEVQGLLDNILEASRSLAVELSPPVLMDAGLAAALNWLSKRLEHSHNLKVHTDIDPEAEPEAEAVRHLLFNAVRELLFNVTKHAGVNEATLTMKRVPDDQLEIVVSDQGVGLDPATLGKSTDARSAFGLTHLKDRIRLIGGSLVLVTAPGEGCRVTMTAPRALPGQPPDITSKGGRYGDAIINERVRVLLLDDDPRVRKRMARTLASRSDVEVVGEAAQGPEVIELIRRLHPDLVVTDIVLPRGEGLDTRRMIAEEMPEVRVVALAT